MTTTIQLSHGDFDDLVFEQRNKAYGAYQLRQDYSKNGLLALLIAFFITGSLLAIPYIARFFKEYTLKVDNITTTSGPVDLTNKIDEPVTPPPPKPPTPPSSSIASLIPVIGKDQDSITTTEELEAGNPGQFTFDGPEGITGLPPGDEGCVGCGVTGLENNGGQPYTWVEQQPQYPGGEAAMFKFLSDNLVFTERAKTIGLDGQVIVGFVVNKYGKISDISVVRGVGGGLDEEAVRVVKMMPPWKPGKNAGHPVDVRFNLPINFKLTGS